MDKYTGQDLYSFLHILVLPKIFIQLLIHLLVFTQDVYPTHAVLLGLAKIFILFFAVRPELGMIFALLLCSKLKEKRKLCCVMVYI